MEAANSARASLLDLLTGLGPADWSRRAVDGGWSVADIIGHIQLSEDGSVRALFRAFRDAKKAGLGPETRETSVLHELDGFDLVDSPNARRAPDFTIPQEQVDPGTLIERLATTRRGLHTWAAEADGYALGDVTFVHPALGALTLYQWVLFLAQHERRHLKQVARILGRPTAP